jgi:hypothetical protein
MSTAQFPTSITTQLFEVVARLSTTLTADIDDDDEPLPVASTAGFPSAGFVVIDNETIYYSALGVDSLTVGASGRGFAGTAASHTSGTQVKLAVVAEHFNRFRVELIATQNHIGISGSTYTTTLDYKIRNLPAQGVSTVVTNLNAQYFGGSTKGEIIDYVDDRVNTLLANLSPADAELPATYYAEKVLVYGTYFPYTVLRFDPDTQEYAYWRFIVPPTYQGGNLQASIHYKTSVNSGAVRLATNIAAVADGETYDVNPTGVGMFRTETVPGTAGQKGICTLDSSNVGVDLVAGDEVIIELHRTANYATDTCTADVDVTMVEIREV